MAHGGPAQAGRYARTTCWIAVAGALFFPACRRDTRPAVERQENIVPVAAVAAEKAAIRAVLHVSGIVVPEQGGEFLVLAPEPARLVDVTKAAGDQVQSGDVLARFDLPSAAQNVSRLTAEAAAAEAQFENARINHDRVRGFVERGMVPRRDLESAERELADAQGSVERARSSLAAAQAGAGRAVVRAPFAGVVAARSHNPGDLVVSTTDPVLRVVDPRRLEVIASVPRKDQSRVVVGASARIAAAGTEQVRLTVAGRAADPAGADLQVGASANASASSAASDDSVRFRLVFAEPPSLAVDSLVQLDIDAEERTDTVLIPAEALVRDGDTMAVFVAAGSRAELRPVKTGIQDETRVEITDGVRAGEQVITRGHIGLTDGAAITVAVQ